MSLREIDEELWTKFNYDVVLPYFTKFEWKENESENETKEKVKEVFIEIYRDFKEFVPAIQIFEKTLHMMLHDLYYTFIGRHLNYRKLFESVVSDEFLDNMYEINDLAVVYYMNWKIEDLDTRMEYCMDKIFNEFFENESESKINWCLYFVMKTMYEEEGQYVVGNYESAQNFFEKFNNIYNELRNKYT